METKNPAGKPPIQQSKRRKWIKNIFNSLKFPFTILAINFILLSLFKYFLDENALELRLVDKLGNYY